MEGRLSESDGAALLPALLAIDWDRPWFAGIAPCGRALIERLRAGAPLVAALNAERDACNRVAPLVTGRGRALTFVPQQALPQGRAYEAHIAATGEVPTRDNLHDVFNALVWLRFPRTKAMLNRLQADAIAAEGIGARRGPVRDAATVFDENGAIFLGSEPDGARQLRAFDWQGLFVRHRHDWPRQRAVLPFGHALLEKLGKPYKAITAHAWALPVPPAAGIDAVDVALATSLGAAAGAGLLHGRCFAPLPVLGIPGWWDGNADPAFYDDPAVFRPGRRHGDRAAPGDGNRCGKGNGADQAH